MKSKFLLNITTILTLALFSCAGENKDENISFTSTKSVMDSDDVTKEIFTELENPSTELTEEQLMAFESRAIQKFKDFTDYIKILYNPKVDDNMTKHSLNLALELFKNDSILIKDTNLIESFADVHHIGQPIYIIDFLNLLYFELHKKTIQVKVKSIELVKPLILDSTNSYNGLMKASLIIENERINLQVDIHLAKIQKDFGENSQSIMEVRLGNIY